MLLGLTQKASATPTTAGRLDIVNGWSVWRVVLRSADAPFLVPAFGTYRVGPDVHMHAHTPSGSVIETRTVADERDDGSLWFPPIAWDSVIIELSWPVEDETPDVELNQLVVGVEDIFEHLESFAETVGLEDHTSELPGA